MTLLLALLVQESVFDADLGRATLHGGARVVEGVLEADAAFQHAELPFPPLLDGAAAASVAAWVHPRRGGEQPFVVRGAWETGPGGERLFGPRPDAVTFLLASDPRGFFTAALHGNGSMPFPFVTLDPLPCHEWSRLVVVKDARGVQTFFRNGVRVWSDADSAWSGVVRPFRETAPEPLRLRGRVAEVRVWARALSDDEVRADFEAGRARRAPALPPRPAALRDMDRRPEPGLWRAPIRRESWGAERDRILAGMRRVFGPMPERREPLDPRDHDGEDAGAYVRRKVSIQVEPGDRMPFWLLVPKRRTARAPAVICCYGTTSGAGKDTTVGLSGPGPGTPPAKNRAFAIDFAEAGFVALAPDLLRDGERIVPGKRPYDTTDFYAKHPERSIHGKDAWDLMRAVDYLETLDFVDASRIGLVGHSYGGHTTIFTAALEPRIRAAWANGPVSDFLGHGMHWGVPAGGGASQSLPAMRPYLLDRSTPPPVAFYEIEALIAPRALVVAQAVGERRPRDEENAAALDEVWKALGVPDRLRCVWVPGDHDFPPHARAEAVAWFRRQFE